MEKCAISNQFFFGRGEAAEDSSGNLVTPSGGTKTKKSRAAEEAKALKSAPIESEKETPKLKNLNEKEKRRHEKTQKAHGA